MRILFILTLQVLVCVSPVLAAITSCYNDHYSWTYQNFCLEIVMLDKSWYDARNYCASRGGDLVEIRTQDFQNSVVNHLSTHYGGHHGFWIGATDTDTEGKWKWLHNPRDMTWSHWSPGQGGSGHGFLFGGLAEDCAMIRTDYNYGWHDGPCEGVVSSLHYSFICQYVLATHTNTTPPTTTRLPTSEPVTQAPFPTEPTEYEPVVSTTSTRPTTTTTAIQVIG